METAPSDPQKVRLATSIFTLFLLVLCLALYLVLSPFLPAAVWAVVMALTTWPLYRKLSYFLNTYRAFAPAIMTALSAAVIVGIFLPLALGVSNEVQEATQNAKRYISFRSFDRAVKNAPLLTPSIKSKISSYIRGFDTSEAISEHQETIVGIATIAARGVLDTLFNLSVCFIVLYTLYSRGERIAYEIYVVLTEIGGPRFKKMSTEVRQVTRAAVYGMVMTSLAQGICAGIGYYVAGAPVPLLLGILTTVLSLLPLGAPVIYLPVALFVGLQPQGALAGILLALWGVCVVSIIDNVLRPYFISKASALPFLHIMAGVIGGYVAYGLVGIIIGPVIISLARVLWSELLTLRQPPKPSTAEAA